MVKTQTASHTAPAHRPARRLAAGLGGTALAGMALWLWLRGRLDL